ncbi:hypothetical protein, partial [Ligilactobacillus agilis]|uniref:hypothetical protein n=1 Tax=Ligilactobacillus agilis TaxID=1601 RepID=UPI001CDD9027
FSDLLFKFEVPAFFNNHLITPFLLKSYHPLTSFATILKNPLTFLRGFYFAAQIASLACNNGLYVSSYSPHFHSSSHFFCNDLKNPLTFLRGF